MHFKNFNDIWVCLFFCAALLILGIIIDFIICIVRISKNLEKLPGNSWFAYELALYMYSKFRKR